MGSRWGRLEVEAEIISGTSLRRKESDSHDLLKVTHIDGRKVETPPVMRSSVPGFVSVKLPIHVFSLYEMMQGSAAKRLASEELAELEKGDVGGTLRRVVYEEGRFRGLPDFPNEWPKDIPVRSDVGFHCSTSLTVSSERKAETSPVRTKS